MAVAQSASTREKGRSLTNLNRPPDESDAEVTVSQLRGVMAEFVQQREWEQFHSPKNLAMSVAIEAAELMEHFQWITVEASRQIDAATKVAVAEELSDVLCYLLALANSMDIDISSSMMKKMQRNREKYPADKFRGRYGHKDRT